MEPNLFYPVLCIVLTLCLFPVHCEHNVTVMIYGMSAPRFIQALPFTAAGFDLGLRDAKELYPGRFNVTLEYITSNEVGVCPDFDAHYHLVAEYYYKKCGDRNSVCALFYPGCNPTTTLASLTREWNLFALNSGVTFSHLRNRSLYPTTIDFAPFQYSPYGVMVLRLMQMYNWTSVAMVYDNSTRQLFNILVYSEIEKQLKMSADNVQFSSFPINSSGVVDYERLVLAVSKLARVVLISTLPDTARNILMAFYRLGSSEKEYVRICMDGPSNPFGPLKYSFGDGDDEIALQSFSATFALSMCYEYGAEMTALLAEMKDRAISQYNATFRAGTGPSIFVVSSYASVLLYYQSLIETEAEGSDIRDGRIIAMKLLNRTFTLPKVGKMYSDKNGERQDVICLSNFRPTTRTFEQVLRYDCATSQMMIDPDQQIYWGTPDNRPPLSKPRCGFLNEAPQCNSDGITLKVALAAACCVFLLVVAGAIEYLRRTRKKSRDFDWWTIDLNKLTKPCESRRFDHLQVSAATFPLARRFSKTTYSQTHLGDIMVYNGKTVRVQTVRVMHKPVFTRVCQETLNEFRRLANVSQNVNRLTGIALQPGSVTFVKEHCQRGGIDALLDEIAIDINLKVSLIRDIVQGLYHIHRSFIGRHGHLRPSKCIVDKSFNVQITQTGMYDLLRELRAAEKCPRKLDDYGESFVQNFVAPEYRDLCGSFAQLALAAKQTADIYALGGIISHILQDQRYSVEGQPADEFEPSAIALDILRTTTENCQNPNPAKRPLMKDVRDLVHAIPGVHDNCFLENLIQRLENYSNQLENTVALRTEALCLEKQKCDQLLAELLPKQVLAELRTGLSVHPRIFSSVTLLFTYVNGFDAFVVKRANELMDVVIFLSEMFSAFDHIIVRFDCHKVETVTDSCLVASGIPVENDGEHVFIIGRLAAQLLRKFRSFNSCDSLDIQIGINTGSCAAGIIGSARPRYCVFGETVNLASRLGTTSEPGKIHLSASTAVYLMHDPSFRITERGRVSLKGFGTISTYWMESLTSETSTSYATTNDIRFQGKHYNL